MGISYKVGHWLNANGYDAIHLNDENLYQLSDDLILEKAIRENRIILTADMDFGQMIAFNKYAIVSVIQFRIFNLTVESITAKLDIVFKNYIEQLQTTAVLITVQENKIRFKALPI